MTITLNLDFSESSESSTYFLLKFSEEAERRMNYVEFETQTVLPDRDL